jgi:serine/threonine protein kinase
VIGTSIGNYRIERLIGEGGMGKVYLAEHPSIGRQAAVKVLTPTEAGDPQIVSRFILEARAANAIRHPNIVDIYDSGVLDGGTPYIVMEYLEGETLAQTMARGRVAVDDAIDWGCQIAEALAAAHARDVVHRDLKPDNLFLVADPRRFGKKQIKVLDFGIAKLQRRSFDQVHMTRTGALLGTPLYMSPEQCMSMKNIDARTDIYSLGVILYEMAAGRRPFDGDGVYAVISMHINEKPVPPRTYRPELPADVEAIILQALAKSPLQRQASMALLHASLELARGDQMASNEALARSNHDRLKPVPLPTLRQDSPPEIHTLTDTAVSKAVTSRTAPGRGNGRVRIVWGMAIIVGLLALYAFIPRGERIPARSESVSAAPAPVAPTVEPRPVAPVAAPVVPAPPAAVTIGLDSTPAGASVYVGDTLIGSTPTTFPNAKPGEPVEFVFRRQGFEPERVKAMAAPGLTVHATFARPVTVKRLPAGKHKRASTPTSAPSSDIQTER